MKVSNRPSYYGREDDLRVSVLRKTVPKSYFKYKARLIKTMTKEATMMLLNDIKKCKNFFSKSKKKEQKIEKSTKEIDNFEPLNYRVIAADIIKKLGIGKKPEKGEKKIVDEKSGKVMRLLYF